MDPNIARILRFLDDLLIFHAPAFNWCGMFTPGAAHMSTSCGASTRTTTAFAILCISGQYVTTHYLKALP